MLIVSGVLVFIFFATLLINIIFGPHMRRISLTDYSPAVSVLIPARNEEHNIATCLESFLGQEYPDFEIIVLDDESEDGTARVVTEIERTDQRIKLIKGKPLPEDWLGKNWACMQLQQHARGEILLFADADTQPTLTAIRHTVDWIKTYNLGLFSVFPQQITKGFAEKLLVPLIDFVLYSLLPLWAVYIFPSRFFAAANGQWLAFTRNAYDQIGKHVVVKNQIVEDVAFSREAKVKNIKTLTASGKDVIFCRMYSSFQEIWNGLSKNFYGLMGNNIFVLIMINCMMLLAYVVPFIFLGLGIQISYAGGLIGIIVFMRLLMSIFYGHHVWISIFFHQVMILFGIFIALNSFYATNRKSVSWKGRRINTPR